VRVVTRGRVLTPSSVLVAGLLVAASLAGCTAEHGEVVRPDASAAAVEAARLEAHRPADDADGAGGDRSATSRGTPVVDAEGVEAALAGLATALRASDQDALDPWLADPSSDVGERWRARATNLAEVPLATYELSLDPELPALTTTRVRERWGADAQTVLVVEEHAFEGHDVDGPRREVLVLTLVPDGSRWALADDQGGGALGLVRGVHLWDLGPVETTARGPLLALHRPGAGGIEPLLTEAEAALALARDRWPLPWSERVPVLVPADADELADLLNVTFDLDSFIAFATATPVIEPGDHRLTGARIVLNPARFDDRDPRTRELVLVHELLHVASRPYAATSTPLWLEEGVAQVLGEQRSSTGTRLLEAAGAPGRRLPLDAEFTTGGRDGIHLAYQRAWSFTDQLVARFGAERVARFYEQVGVGSVRDPGTVSYRVDRAARAVFGEPLDDLVAAWRSAA
jgi:hypothetical protein